jgi:hypothetical protein
MRIRITTDRLPQPERHRGAVLDVSAESGASLIEQGFAEAVDEAVATPAKRRRAGAAQ